MVRLVLFAIPIAYVSVFVFLAPIDGVWWGLLVGSAGSTAAAALLVRRIVWQQDPTTRATRTAPELEAAAMEGLRPAGGRCTRKPGDAVGWPA